MRHGAKRSQGSCSTTFWTFLKHSLASTRSCFQMSECDGRLYLELDIEICHAEHVVGQGLQAPSSSVQGMCPQDDIQQPQRQHSACESKIFCGLRTGIVELPAVAGAAIIDDMRCKTLCICPRQALLVLQALMYLSPSRIQLDKRMHNKTSKRRHNTLSER